MVHPRLINDDLRAVAELFAFVAANPAEARAILGPSPWDQLTQAHADSWFRQVTRIPHRPALTDRYYVDDHALAQITAALPLLGLPRDQQMPITRGDGTQVLAAGLDDPQAMRMILLQILTGRRASEIRTCDFDCLSPVPGSLVAADGEQIARFSYAQSKIDIAPDSILVDREVIAVIEEQQDWVRAKLPGITPRYLFLRRTGNKRGDKPYTSGTYNWMLREFSDIAQITDSKGTAGPAQPHPPVPAHQADPSRRARPAGPRPAALCRARHPDHVHALHRPPRGTRRAGVPGHRQAQGRRHPGRVLPRGPRHPAPVRPRRPAPPARLVPAAAAADLRQGQRLPDLLGLRHRRDPPPALERQLADTGELITRTTAAFQERHGRPMPDDNVWLAQRRAEQQALTRLLTTMQSAPGRAVQGAGCGAAPGGPVPLALDLARHRRTTVTDGRARRVAVLATAAKAKSEAKTKAAEQAIRSLVKRGQPITFQAVQREAGVSHAFLYGHPELRGRIECLRAQARPAPIRADPAESADTLVLALTSQINQLKKRHRQEVHELRAALEQAHGENLELRRELTRRGWTPQPAAHLNIVTSIATTT